MHSPPQPMGDLQDVGKAVSDPIGLFVLATYGIGGALVGGAAGWVFDWPMGKSAIVGAAVPVLGILAIIAFSPPKPKPPPVSSYEYR